jgi:hypothetical protein
MTIVPQLGTVVDSAPATSSSPRMECKTTMPRRRFQSGRVYLRGTRWVGSYREYEVNPETGKRARKTITFDESVTSKRAAQAALQPYLDDYNARAKADSKPSATRGGKAVRALIEEWTDKYFQTESQEERVQPCRTFGHTYFHSLPRFSYVK